MDSSKTITHVSLCAGYGGIDLGLRRCINMRTIAYAEIEAFAVELLLARMEEGQLDAAPIWTDLKSFPWSSFYGKVDILSGGYPCQPFSAAGKRQGADDPRHLWPWIADGIRVCRPAVCFFENVEGHITLGLRNVLHDLAGMGYRTTWGIFSASEIGAPHQRKRVFILAYRSDSGLQGQEWFWQTGTKRESSRYTSKCGGSMADATNWRRESLHDGNAESEDAFSRCAWPSRPGQQQFGWEPPRVVEPPLGRDADGAADWVGDAELFKSCDNLTDELRILGNGVVPQTVERAWRVLSDEIIQYGVKT